LSDFRRFPALNKLVRFLPWSMEITGVSDDGHYFFLRVRNRVFTIGFRDKHLSRVSFGEIVFLVFYCLGELCQTPCIVDGSVGIGIPFESKPPGGDVEKQS